MLRKHRGWHRRDARPGVNETQILEVLSTDFVPPARTSRSRPMGAFAPVINWSSIESTDLVLVRR